MLLALTTGQRLGIALAALAFIVFALLSSFWFPRRDPDFPGKRLPLFVLVTIALFLAVVGAMVFLAHEEEAGGHDGEAVETTETTETTETEPGGGPPAEIPEDPEGGNPEAGREIYAAQGCGGCHTFQAAGSEANVAPNLDESQMTFGEARDQIENGGGGMPPFGDRLSDDELDDVAAFVTRERAG